MGMVCGNKTCTNQLTINHHLVVKWRIVDGDKTWTIVEHHEQVDHGLCRNKEVHHCTLIVALGWSVLLLFDDHPIISLSTGNIKQKPTSDPTHCRVSKLFVPAKRNGQCCCAGWNKGFDEGLQEICQQRHHRKCAGVIVEGGRLSWRSTDERTNTQIGRWHCF